MAAELAWRLAGGGDEIAAAPIGGGAYELWLSIDGYTLQFRVGGTVRRILRGEPSREKAKEAAHKDWVAISTPGAADPQLATALSVIGSAAPPHGPLNPKPGDTLLRVTPPIGGRPGHIQRGIVERVSEDTIELVVQLDVPRRLPFRRSDGADLSGLGTFLVQV